MSTLIQVVCREQCSRFRLVSRATDAPHTGLVRATKGVVSTDGAAWTLAVEARGLNRLGLGSGSGSPHQDLDRGADPPGKGAVVEVRKARRVLDTSSGAKKRT